MADTVVCAELTWVVIVFRADGGGKTFSVLKGEAGWR